MDGCVLRSGQQDHKEAGAREVHNHFPDARIAPSDRDVLRRGRHHHTAHRRSNPRVGEVVVHFPRTGVFVIPPADG